MTALALKWIACVAMLLDHIGFAAGIDALRMIGRIAFPIYLYLIYNGYRYTSNKLRYALRLGIFALISQIPFSLFLFDTIISVNGNVLFTLLICFICIWFADTMRSREKWKGFALAPAMGCFFLYQYGILRSEYGAEAVLAAMAFLYIDGRKWYHPLLLTVVYAYCVFYEPIVAYTAGALQGAGMVLPILSAWDRMQIFAIAAFPLIFSYNGKKGEIRGGKWAQKLLQYGFYAFYPAHLLVLWLIFW